LLGVGRKADSLLRKNIVTKSKEAMAGLSEGQLAEASEEGLGSKGAVVPMMMMMSVCVCVCVCVCVASGTQHEIRMRPLRLSCIFFLQFSKKGY